MTPFQKHAAKWKDCRRCPLWKGRSRVVIARGSIPCDVLFVGEAPGVSEDVLGVPFVGPAGKLMDNMVGQAIRRAGLIDEQADCSGAPDPWTISWAFCNLVGCFPKEEKESGVNEPPEEAIKTCSPKLQEIVKLASPRLLVAVGGLARDWLDQKRKYSIKLHKRIPMVSVKHPAAILRENLASRGLSIQRVVVTIQNAVEELAS